MVHAFIQAVKQFRPYHAIIGRSMGADGLLLGSFGKMIETLHPSWIEDFVDAVQPYSCQPLTATEPSETYNGLSSLDFNAGALV